MNKILIVEDDKYISTLLENLLVRNQYKTEKAFTGTEAIDLCNSFKPNLVLLDLMLPDIQGDKLLDKLDSKTPKIIISAKNNIKDKVYTLKNGANDYITKPFEIDELLARIEVQFRNVQKVDKVIKYDEIEINLETHEVYVNENEMKLTKSEFAILWLLMSNPNVVYTRSMIFEKIWNDESFADEQAIKVHISNLRSKIKEHTDKKYIETVWGIGFKFCID